MNYIELIAKLTQTGSLAEYHTEFEKMLNRTQGLPESTLLPIYLGGLRQPVRKQVRFQHPQSVAAVMALATEFDSVAGRVGQQPRKSWQTRDFHGPPSTFSSAAAAPDAPKSAGTTGQTAQPFRDLSKLPIVRLSSAERTERS